MNKQLTSFQNSFGILSRRCQGKSWKSFYPSNVPSGNTNPLRGKHVARELRFELACRRL